MVEVLVTYDPIYHVNTKDKQMLLAAGSIKKEDVIKSLFAYKTLQSIVSTNGTTYLEKPLTEIFTDLDNALKPIIDQYIPKQVIELSEGENIPQNTEIQLKEAEAKANLKGSVGGVQGIIAIQQSVAKGFTDRASAISLLMEIYGFTEDVANNMVGTPKDISNQVAPTTTTNITI
ncbi:MAG: hypothetical protein ACKOQP_06415 [Bacteroidota bacterium]